MTDLAFLLLASVRTWCAAVGVVRLVCFGCRAAAGWLSFRLSTWSGS